MAAIITRQGWGQQTAPPYRPLNKQSPFLSAPSIFYSFGAASPFLDLSNGGYGTPTGTAAPDGEYGLVTSSGNYLTGSTARPKFASSNFFFATEIEIGAGVVSSTISAYTEPFGSNNLFRLDVWNNGGGFVGLAPYFYIAGSYRNGILPGVNVGTVTAGQRFVIACKFVQPVTYGIAFLVTDVGTVPSAISWTSTGNYGAPMGDGGSAPIFGKDVAGTHPFDGKIRYALYSQYIPDSGELYELLSNPWGTLFAPYQRRLYFGAAAGGFTGTITTGSLVKTGKIPGTTIDYRFLASTGSMVKTSQIPTLYKNFVFTPSTGSIVKTGQVPIVTKQFFFTPTAGSLVKTGQTPILTTAGHFTPLTGSIVKTGQQPVIYAPMTPTTGQIIKTGQVPILTISGGALAALRHSWFVKAIGVKTKIGVNSQVDSDTGDTP